MSAKPIEPAASARDAVREHYILCVDDDIEFLKSLEFFLPGQINTSNEIWYRFLFISDPVEALSILRELQGGGETVAMIMSDQKMPQMKGTELLRQAKAISETSVCVLLTGHAGMESAIVAINERLLDKYLTKPIENEHAFTHSIRHRTDRFHMRRTIEAQNRAIHELYAFSNTLNAIDDLDDMLGSVLAFTRSALGCDAGALFLLEEGALTLRASRGFGSDSGHAAVSVDASGALDTLATTEAVAIGSCSAIPLVGALVAGATNPAISGPFLYAGLGSCGSPMGLLVAGRPRGAAFTPADLRAATCIADTAAIAIRNQQSRAHLEGAYADSRRHAEELAEAHARLRILDELKTDFLSFISHELRTPLNAIAAIDMVEHCASPDEQTEVIAIIRRGYERLHEFVKKGLDYFDLYGGGCEPRRDSVDLAETARAAARSLPELALPNVSLSFETPEAPCLVVADGEMLSGVLRTLLENALKFTDDEKCIRVRVRECGERSEIEVSDDGVGFPPWNAEIFRLFTIADSNHHAQGTALSLARAQAIVAAMGGRIRAESAGPGQGATFRVELPAAIAALTTA